MKTVMNGFIMLVVAACLFLVVRLSIEFLGITDTLIGVGCLIIAYHLTKDL